MLARADYERGLVRQPLLYPVEIQVHRGKSAAESIVNHAMRDRSSSPRQQMSIDELVLRRVLGHFRRSGQLVGSAWRQSRAI